MLLFLAWAISRFIFSGVKIQGGVSGNWNLAEGLKVFHHVGPRPPHGAQQGKAK